MPSWANRWAVARPMPPAAPVTNGNLASKIAVSKIAVSKIAVSKIAVSKIAHVHHAEPMLIDQLISMVPFARNDGPWGESS